MRVYWFGEWRELKEIWQGNCPGCGLAYRGGIELACHEELCMTATEEAEA